MTAHDAVSSLIAAFAKLPGIGPRSAERISYHLLQYDRNTMARLAESLQTADTAVRPCASCRSLSGDTLCAVCSDPSRDETVVCVTETPADMQKIEKTGVYNGRYFVLMGRLSPLDRIAPEDIGMDVLSEVLAKGTIRELVLALGSTAEAEATAHYIGQLAAQHDVRVSQLARGVPIGGELEFVDGQTLAHAFRTRHTCP